MANAPLRVRPIRAGVSVSGKRFHAGTLGCFVRIRGASDGAVHLLSNNHVLARVNRGRRGEPILQPARAKGGTVDDTVAALSGFVRLYPNGRSNEVDAAIAKLVPDAEYDLTIPRLGRLTGAVIPSPGMKVCKVGAVTGYTEGVITTVDHVDKIKFTKQSGALYYSFVNQIRIEPTAPYSAMAYEGDSGALVVEKDTGRAVGLHFSGPKDGSYSLANPIQTVLEELNVALL